MEMKWIEDFLVLARTNNFTQAAELRNVTQSAFSRRIRALEIWLGRPLVDRSTYPTRLTDDGRLFLSVANEVVLSLGQIRDDFHQQNKEKAVTFAVPHTLSLYFLPSWIERAREGLGDLEIRVLADNMHDCVQMLMNGDCDFLVCFFHPEVPVEINPRQFDYRIVGQDCLRPVSATDSDGKPMYPIDNPKTASGPYLSYGRSSFLGQILAQVIQRVRNFPNLNRVYQNSFTESLKVMAVEGYGIAWLPCSCTEREVESGTLISVGDTSMEVPLEIRIYRKKGELSEPAALLWPDGEDG